MKYPIAILLHNIRSSHNVGSLFRTADGAGVEWVYLSGYTPHPVDKFKRANKELTKTALGADTYIPWSATKSPMRIISDLKKDGWEVVGIEQDDSSHDYRSFSITKPTLFVLGNEVLGLSQQLKKACDVLVEIPMHGKKESLNVAVAGGVVLFGVSR